MISTFCFIIAALIIAETTIRRTEMFTPFKLYLFGHSMTFGIANLKLTPDMTPFSFESNAVYYGSGICYLLGTLIISTVVRTTSANISKPNFPDSSKYRWGLHFALTFPLFVYYILGMLIALKGTGTFPIFADKTSKAILAFMGYSMISNLGIGFVGLTLILLFVSALSGKPRFLGINISMYLCIFVVIFHLFTLSRSSIIFFGFFALAYLNFYRHRIKILRLVSIVLLLFSIFSLVAYQKISSITDNQKTINIDKQQVIQSIIDMPYLYIANNFWNLDYGISTENYQAQHRTSWGFTTLSGIFDLIWTGEWWGYALRNSLNYEDIFHKKTMKVSGLNTVSYQWGLYKDFGIPGTYIIPFLFGLAVSILYWKVRLAPTIFNVSVYCFLAYFIFMSWFLAFWEIQLYIYGLFFLIILGLLCQHSKPSDICLKK